MDAAAAAKASLRSRFDATTRAWVKSLHEPTRRATAREAMARFESERAAVGEVPLEAALRREIDALGREPASATRDARMALRRTAFDLLFHGGTDLGAQVGPVAGLRLAALRAEVDARLSMPRREGLAPAAVDTPLARFAAAAAAIVPGPTVDGPSPEVV
ncbi:MAG: hypothetical protein ACKORL_03465, partial [Phycisphaerales bacterium]